MTSLHVFGFKNNEPVVDGKSLIARVRKHFVDIPTRPYFTYVRGGVCTVPTAGTTYAHRNESTSDATFARSRLDRRSTVVYDVEKMPH